VTRPAGQRTAPCPRASEPPSLPPTIPSTHPPTNPPLGSPRYCHRHQPTMTTATPPSRYARHAHHPGRATTRAVGLASPSPPSHAPPPPRPPSLPPPPHWCPPTASRSTHPMRAPCPSQRRRSARDGRGGGGGGGPDLVAQLADGGALDAGDGAVCNVLGRVDLGRGAGVEGMRAAGVRPDVGEGDLRKAHVSAPGGDAAARSEGCEEVARCWGEGGTLCLARCCRRSLRGATKGEQGLLDLGSEVIDGVLRLGYHLPFSSNRNTENARWSLPRGRSGQKMWVSYLLSCPSPYDCHFRISTAHNFVSLPITLSSKSSKIHSSLSIKSSCGQVSQLESLLCIMKCSPESVHLLSIPDMEKGTVQPCCDENSCKRLK
jgi:hypothetical protein